MNMPSLVLVVLCIFGFLTLCSNTEAAPTYRLHFCKNLTSFTPKSTYESNLNRLLSSLTSNASNDDVGYYYTTVGSHSQDPNSVIYGSFLCRGDLNSSMCQECMATAARDTVQYCPLRKVTYLWYDECMIRYSNVSFFGNMEEVPRVYMRSVNNITEANRFNWSVARTVASLVPMAAIVPDGDKKFATREEDFTASQRLYGLAQCTPDLSTDECERCLQNAIANFQIKLFEERRGGRVISPSCNVRYDVEPFYTIVRAPAPPSPPPSVARPRGNDDQISPIIIVAIVVPIIVILLFSVVLA